MRFRTHARTGWEISEIGYGMWGLGGWTGSDDRETMQALEESVALGCNFFDTAWAYGAGHSERLLGELLRAHPDQRLYVATKVPPKNQRWIQLDGFPLDAVFPPDHIREYTEKSLKNLGIETIDVQQLHAWSDKWAADERWQRVMDDLTREGLVKTWGISVNRWEPTNVVKALDTGLIDWVQVVYNIFDQNPEDELLPYCQTAWRRGHRARAVRRGQPHRHAFARIAMARGGLAQSLLHARAPRCHVDEGRGPAAAGPHRDDAARAGAPFHPAPPGGDDDDPRHAEARERARELRGQRWPAASADAD